MPLSENTRRERAVSSLLDQPSNIPIPDPSLITAQEIAKAKAELRNEFALALAGLRETLIAARDGYIATINARLDGIEKASALLDGNLGKVPSALDREASRLERLLEEKVANIHILFDNVSTRFVERDLRFNQDKAAVAASIEAALRAQKDAARAQNDGIAATFAKSESSFTKEIDSLKALINATRDTITANVVNLTGRLDRGEGGQHGARQAVTDRQANTGAIVGVIGGAVGVLGLIVALAFGVINTASSRSAAPVVPPPALASENAKRLDDIINQNNEQNRLLNSRLDMLSNRLTNGPRPP